MINCSQNTASVPKYDEAEIQPKYNQNTTDARLYKWSFSSLLTSQNHHVILCRAWGTEAPAMDIPAAKTAPKPVSSATIGLDLPATKATDFDALCKG